MAVSQANWDKAVEIVKKEYPSVSEERFYKLVNGIAHNIEEGKKSMDMLDGEDGGHDAQKSLLEHFYDYLHKGKKC